MPLTTYPSDAAKCFADMALGRYSKAVFLNIAKNGPVVIRVNEEPVHRALFPCLRHLEIVR